MAYEELTIEGRNAVIEAFRAGKTVDKIFVLEGCKDGPIQTVLREAKAEYRCQFRQERTLGSIIRDR